MLPVFRECDETLSKCMCVQGWAGLVNLVCKAEPREVETNVAV